MADDEAEGEAIEGEVADAIAQVMAKHNAMVVKWVALIEVMESDGQRSLWTLTSEGVMAWDTVGLLQHGLHLQHSQTLVAECDGE